MGKWAAYQSQPEAFTHVASKVIRELDASDFWLWLVLIRKEAATAIARSKNEDFIAGVIMENEAAYLVQTERKRRARAATDAKGKGNSKGNGKGKGKSGGDNGKSTPKPPKRYGTAGPAGSSPNGSAGKFKDDPNSSVYVPGGNAFKYSDGSQASRINPEDYNRDSQGVLVFIDQYIRIMHPRYGG